MQINAGNLRAFDTDVRLLFQQGMETSVRGWSVDQLADMETSSLGTEEYYWAESDETMENWTDKTKSISNLLLRGFDASNQDFHRTFSVKVKVIQRDAVRQITSTMDALVTPSRNWMPHALIEAIRNGGFCNDPSGHAIPYTWLDGKAYFATDHLVNVNDATGPKYSNLFTGTPLSAANITTLRQKMMTSPGIGGKPRGLMPRQLWVPPSLTKTALELTTAVIISNTSNVIPQYGLQLVEIPELEDGSGTWYLAGTRNGRKPVIFQTEKMPTFWNTLGQMANQIEIAGNVDAVVGLTEEVHFGVTARGIALLILPEALYRATP